MKHVAILINASRAHNRSILQGVVRFQTESGNWLPYYQPSSLNSPLPVWIRHRRFDGILARISDTATAKLIRPMGKHVINLLAPPTKLPCPELGLDHVAIGKLAAEYLIGKGYKRFGFVGITKANSSGRPTSSNSAGIGGGILSRSCLLRERGFARVIGDAGYPCEKLVLELNRLVRKPQQQRLIHWLRSLEKPAGVLAFSDDIGLLVLHVCRQIGILIPSDLAVVGVGNDELSCNLGLPPLTSIDTNGSELGYEAARLLDTLMHGGKMSAVKRLIAPRQIVSRGSTEAFGSSDNVVLEAISFIQKAACRGINVEDVCHQLSVSRTLLNQRFRAEINRTVLEVIQQIRIDQVKKLLESDGLPLKSIAIDCGFSSVQYMTRLFHQITGQTPAAYRKRQFSKRHSD
jgi:LacI family transcriptional regulator